MYLFLLFGLPIGFILLLLHAYPPSESGATRRAFGRGLAASIPVWIVARLLGAIVPAIYGSLLLTFHEWADRILPYAALPALCYLVFYRPGEVLPSGAARRRLTAFYAGALSPAGLFESMRIWGSPSPYPLLLLPLILGAICLLMPMAMAVVHGSYGFRMAGFIGAIAALTFLASLCPYLFLARLWPLAILLVAGLGTGAWFFASPELLRRPQREILG
jgi:hypothetical protein